MLPNGHQEPIAPGDTTESVALPDGFSAVSLSILSGTGSDGYTRHYTLKLSITNASLLDGGKIICDNTSSRVMVTAGCPVCGTF